uniref:HTH TFE/IIEalpha-type domain-containing protein n=1 Tax=Syphacia muris TaxID=451379 RepID=A0A0N5ANH9_9BILA
MTESHLQSDSKDGDQKNTILEELPENLLRFAQIVTKAFYGREHYVVVDYVQKNTCIKEEDLRQLLKFDQRFIRSVLNQLKVDKILKERVVSEELDGRARKVNYYFINYRALLNVTKYKIDHMRQRLEVRDKDEVHKASYKCSGCRHHYDAMEMDKIFDPVTQELRCWRCQHIVEPDETAGPTEETRSSLARFNEQMAPLYSMIQGLDGIRLAQHLLEPPLKVIDNNTTDDAHERKVLQVGEVAFKGHSVSRSTMYQNGITVSIEGENATPQVEEKKVVPWLQNQLYSPNSGDDPSKSAFAGLVDDPLSLAEADPVVENPVENEVENLLMEEFEQAPEPSKEPPQKMAKLEEEPEALAESDEEDTITVGGKKYFLDEITPEIVRQMTEAEKEAYINMTREEFEEMF